MKKLKYNPLTESKLAIYQNICSLEAALPLNQTLVKFHLFLIKFDGNMTNCLFKGLLGNTSIETLEIINCNFYGDTYVIIVKKFQKNFSIFLIILEEKF